MKKGMIDRRTFLRGLGVSMALPYLEIMGFGSKAYAATAPKRMIWVYIPNGVVMGGAGSAAPTYLTSLTSSISRKCNYLTGLTTVSLGGCHTDIIPTLTIGGNPMNVSGTGQFTVQNYPKTFDQYIASVNKGLKFDSLSFSARQEPRDQCSSLNAIIYNNSSWTNQGPNYYVDTYFQPLDAYNKMFSGFTSPTNPSHPTNPVDTVLTERLRRKKSALDLVMADINKIQAKATTKDKYALDEYFSSIRTIETDLSKQLAMTPTPGPMPVQPSTSCKQPTGYTQLNTNDETFHLRLNAFYDLMYLAIACDMTRVITLKHAPENTQVFHKSFVPGLTANCGWHTYSHYVDATANGEGAGAAAGDPATRQRDYEILTSWHYNKVADFVKKLDATPNESGEGTLLDSSLVTWGSTIGYSNGHSTDNLFWQTAGSAGGKIATGKTLQLGQTPISNLWLTAMNAFGAGGARFGNSTGEIGQIKA